VLQAPDHTPEILTSPMLARVESLQCRVMYACNNDCYFCLDRSEVDGEFHGGPRALPAGHVLRVLEERAGKVDVVVFTHGEPTLHPDLPRFVEAAVRLGYTTRGLVTNARRLSDARYARSIVDAGVNHFTLSIHGDDAATHDGATRTKAFHQAIAGLRNLATLARERPFKLTTSTVLNHLNYKRTAEIVRFLLDERVDVSVLNVVRPMGNAARHFEAAVPRYRDVVRALEGLFALRPEARRRVAIEDIPPCVAAPVAPFLGVLEAWHLEQVDEGLPHSDSHENPSRDGSAFGVGIPERETTKREACRSCIHDARCWGVWRTYVDTYGWEEFTPITRSEVGEREGSPFSSLVMALAPIDRIAEVVGPAWYVDALVLDERAGKALLTLRHREDGRAFRLGLEGRDDTRQAFRRTDRFNLFYQDRRDLAADEVVALEAAWREVARADEASASEA